MRRKRPRSEVTVALFPFLAVLVCTMGSLIVLLVMVVQQAHVYANDQLEQAENERSEEIQQLTDEYEQYEWRREVLEPQRAEVQKKLADGRSQLSHLEEEIRKIQERWKLLAEQAAKFSAPPTDDANVNSLELARVNAQLANAKAELDELKKKAAKRTDSYAIIPYDGPNGTRRRPIYIECKSDRLIIQPEGLVLTEADFQGPIGPGNPLDAALRAIREHLSQLANVNPYPLLIVRPDGARAYAMARQAMSGWDDEFGYELIDAGMKLEYEQSDPALSEKLRRTVAAARQRQILLAAAMPRQFRGSGGNGFVVSSRGGLRPIGGMADDDGSGTGTGVGRRSAGAPGDGEYGGGYGGGESRRGVAPGERSFGDGGRRDQYAGHNPSATTGVGGASATPGQASPHDGRPGDYYGQQGESGQGEPGQGEPGQGEQQQGSQRFADGQTSGDGKDNSAFRPPGNNAAGGSQSGGPGGPAGAGGGAWGGAIAKSRGGNWGLPRSNNFAQAVKRPLRVACLSNRLIILPGKNEFFVPVATELSGDMRSDVQKFVSSLWNHMEGWGMAVAGGYWTPVLKVEVQDGAEDNFRALEVLLKDSGIQVTRSQP